MIIDDIVLYDAAPVGETQPFPRRVLFTAWFDRGKQGVEWPGDFEIVNNDAPLTWKAAKSVGNPQTGQPWIRVHLRGARPLSDLNRLRFRYRLTGSDSLTVVLAESIFGVGEWYWHISHLGPVSVGLDARRLRCPAFLQSPLACHPCPDL